MTLTKMTNRAELTRRAKEADIEGYGGIYKITEHGDVISLARQYKCPKRGVVTVKERVLRPSISPNGYVMITLSKSGETKTYTVHSLVAAAFIGPRPDGMQVCHRDNDPTNNHYLNLRYDTPIGNNADKIKHGTQQRGEKASNAKLTEKKVREIRALLKQGEKQRDVAGWFGVSKSLIAAISTKKVWSHVD